MSMHRLWRCVRGRWIHESAHGLKRQFARLHHAQEGSGTVAGIALIMVAVALISASAGMGHVVIRHAHARSAADLASFTAALAWHSGQGSPCAVAEQVSSANDARVLSCRTEGTHRGDVEVRVVVRTGVPIMPEAAASARAGPVACH